MKSLNKLPLFVTVVETGSFTAAADKLNVPKSSVSRAVSRLEAELGVRLLQRTTRQLRLTEAGSRFFQEVQQALRQVASATHELSQWQSSPQGHLRLTLPVELGMQFMGQVLAEFLAQHPQMSLEADLTDRLVDLVAEGVDLGLRIGDFNDAHLIGRRLGQLNGQLFASPAYVARHGMPAHPEDLSQHTPVLFRQVRQAKWSLQDGKAQCEVPVQGRLSSNNAALQLDALVAGAGIGMLPRFLADTAVQRGDLLPVLPHWRMRLGDLWAVTPSRHHMPPGLRALIDYLATVVRQHPWFD